MSRCLFSGFFSVCCLLLLTFSVNAAEEKLLLATTTSTDNTGLLDVLAPAFTRDTGIDLQWIAVGTGKALAMGRHCDVDVLLVHAPAAEMQEVRAGNATNRTELMYNDFIIVGPAKDPAGVKGMNLTEAMKAFAEKNALFCSRGDDSGTNKKEISLWKSAGLAVPDKKSWYVQTGQGMTATLRIAQERDGYCMTDRGTYIKYEANAQGNPALKILVEGDKILFNQYSAMAVNPEKCNKVNYTGAMELITWLASPKAQKAIADFRLMGKQLFTPNAR